MKSIQSLFSLLLLLGLATQIFAAESIYNKDDLRQYISIGADMRFFDIEDLNNTVLGTTPHYMLTADEKNGGFGTVKSVPTMKAFTDQSFAGTLELGVEYQQYLIALGLNLSPRDASARKASSELVVDSVEVEGVWVPLSDRVTLQDASFYTYGVDFKFGYKIFPDGTVLNFIPSFAMGVQVINVEFPALVSGEAEGEEIRPKPYSSLAKVFNPELEVRLKLGGPWHVGGYAGYRFITFDEFKLQDDLFYGVSDLEMDQYYLGAKVTYVWRSNSEKARVR